ncbi:hypothetical protein AVEN_254419-1 [Araneus ventricosus]|uniref:Uncharacterized protein n=1 Tax=Araneus ventricosus TaxID=182803 RepID=A0A4Y2M569_ARAVE|nr:hypothetical protein AVEN_254419-1 [Araneus ventricosus]
MAPLGYSPISPSDKMTGQNRVGLRLSSFRRPLAPLGDSPSDKMAGQNRLPKGILSKIFKGTVSATHTLSYHPHRNRSGFNEVCGNSSVRKQAQTKGRRKVSKVTTNDVALSDGREERTKPIRLTYKRHRHLIGRCFVFGAFTGQAHRPHVLKEFLEKKIKF